MDKIREEFDRIREKFEEWMEKNCKEVTIKKSWDGTFYTGSITNILFRIWKSHQAEIDELKESCNNYKNMYSEKNSQNDKLRRALEEIQDDIQIITIAGVRNIKETLAEVLKESE